MVISPPQIVVLDGARPDTIADLLGGRAQQVPEFTMYKGRRCWVFVDEDGHTKRLPFNHEATRAWRECLDATGIPYRLDMAYLVGDAVVVYWEEVR